VCNGNRFDEVRERGRQERALLIDEDTTIASHDRERHVAQHELPVRRGKHGLGHPWGHRGQEAPGEPLVEEGQQHDPGEVDAEAPDEK